MDTKLTSAQKEKETVKEIFKILNGLSVYQTKRILNLVMGTIDMHSNINTEIRLRQGFPENTLEGQVPS